MLSRVKLGSGGALLLGLGAIARPEKSQSVLQLGLELGAMGLCGLGLG